MIPQFEIILIASLVAVACALLGVFLVLRKVSLMSDAISHAILFGIVIGFFIVKDISSPILIVGAALTGLLTVSITELLIKTKKLKEDASIGLVFPVFFSLGVILISKYASDVHLDTDAVLLGELAFAPFDRLLINGLDLGPKSLWVIGLILAINLVFVLMFYKELKLSTFDAGFAAAIGFSPMLVHYGLMSLVSITAVGSFNAVGSILVVALMIAPPSAAYLLTNDLKIMIFISIGIAIMSSIMGYGLAFLSDASIAGSIAMMAGLFFILALLFSPQNGLIAQALSNKKKKVTFASHMLLVHLLDHEGKKEESMENTISNSRVHMRWKESFTEKVLLNSLASNWITKKYNRLFLTSSGRKVARKVMIQEI
ncbi:metal ABC transporter permease [Candidatus Woesearchaeota archaeon]|nr:metal ABC transporter permease [Candidatus Woesearchaeota archaeon]